MEEEKRREDGPLSQKLVCGRVSRELIERLYREGDITKEQYERNLRMYGYID